jgi:hypothetical protein
MFIILFYYCLLTLGEVRGIVEDIREDKDTRKIYSDGAQLEEDDDVADLPTTTGSKTQIAFDKDLKFGKADFVKRIPLMAVRWSDQTT